MDTVTAVLQDRVREPGGQRAMATFSVLAHAAFVALLILAPGGLGTGPNNAERTVMTISLGGAPGPRAGGMTPMGGRPVQEVAPEPARPEPVRPPAAEAPQMILPAPGAKVPPKAPAKAAPAQARGRTPTRGKQVEAGTSVAETGGRGMGFGLSTGGGGTGGYLDVGNFCCPEYLGTMLQLIQRNWNSRQGAAGEAMVKFTIQRDGRITDVDLERSSGFAALDLGAQRALLLTRQFPPLPGAFPDDHLTVHLRFQYER